MKHLFTMLRWYVGLCLLASLLCTGCAQTKRVPFGSPSTPAVAEMNVKAQKHETRLTFASGKKVRARNLYVGRDSVTWSHPVSGRSHSAPVQSLEEVQFEWHGRGFAEGFLTSAVCSFGTTLAASLAAGGYTGLGIFLFGSIASAGITIIGSAVGAIDGKDVSYRPSASPSAPRETRP